MHAGAQIPRALGASEGKKSPPSWSTCLSRTTRTARRLFVVEGAEQGARALGIRRSPVPRKGARTSRAQLHRGRRHQHRYRRQRHVFQCGCRKHDGLVTAASLWPAAPGGVARAMSLRMSYLAQHDFLTELPNRLLLNDLTQAMTLAQRHANPSPFYSWMWITSSTSMTPGAMRSAISF